MEPRVVSPHKEKNPPMHPNTPTEAAKLVAPAPTCPRPLRSICSRLFGVPGRRRPLRSAALGLQARLRRPRHNAAREPPRRRLCGRPMAHTKAPRPGLAFRPRRAPTLGSGARIPQRLGHRLPDVAAQQAEQERRRPAHLCAAEPRSARPRRPPGPSGASGAAGCRACLHVAWPRARRAPRSNWPRPRPAWRWAPQPPAAPSSAHPGGFPKRWRRGPAHPLTP